MAQPPIWNDKVYLLLLLLMHSISGPCSAALVQDVTYQELEVLGATCRSNDNCKLTRTKDWLYGPYTCNCDRSCAEFDTCCVDSVFRKSEPPLSQRRSPKCMDVYGARNLDVYMVDSCHDNWPRDLAADLCHGDAESMNDPMLLLPATSQLTGITYKNQYCSICNNDTDAPKLFTFRVGSNSSELKNSNSVPLLKYNTSLKQWELDAEDSDGNSEPAYLSAFAPRHLYPMVKDCYVNMVSNCSREWDDDDVRQKCAAYMARIFIGAFGTSTPYRNPHCALCNFEHLDKFTCRKFGQRGVYDKVTFVSLFSLDDKPLKCEKDEVFDSYKKKCRAIKCPPNHSVDNGKCVANR